MAQKFQNCSISLDFILANERHRKSSSTNSSECVYNAYISHFCEQPWIISLRQLANENLSIKKLLNHKTLKKEITELYGALTLFERSLQRSSSLSSRIIPQEENDDMMNLFPCLNYLDSCHRLVFYDICSGRGISSFFISFLFPNSKIILIDSNSKMKLDHFDIPHCKSVKYYNYDIYSDDFSHFLSLESQNNLLNHNLSLLFGLHLCGTLSLRLCSLFNQLPSLPLLIISPCCMPKNKKSNLSHRHHLLKWNQLSHNGSDHQSHDTNTTVAKLFSSYDYWCLTVYYQLDCHQMRREMIDDEWVLSQKSKYILGKRDLENIH